MGYINKIQISNDNNSPYLIEPTLFAITKGTPNNNGLVSVYTANIDDFALVKGATIYLQIHNDNGLNATLNINGLGEKYIYYKNKKIAANYLKKDYLYSLVYDEVNWQLVGSGIEAKVNEGIENALTYYLGANEISPLSKIRWNGTNRYLLDFAIYNEAGNQAAEIQYDAGNTTNITTGSWKFRSFSPKNPFDDITTGKYETYSLPTVNQGLTANQSYDILTTKDLSFSITGTANALANLYNRSSRPTDANITHVTNGGVTHFKVTKSMTSNNPGENGNILHFHWDTEDAWDGQLFVPNGTSHMCYRAHTDASTWYDWRTLLDSGNYSSYALPLTGGTLSGTITAQGFIGPLTGNVTGNCTGSSGSCTGNADTATNWAAAQKVYVALNTASTTNTIQGGSNSAQVIGVDGTLGTANGGTGNTSYTAKRIIWAETSSKLSSAPAMHINWTAGTTNTRGVEELVIGNNIDENTIGNAFGRIALYSGRTNGSYITAADTTADIWPNHVLPATAGWLVTASNSGVGTSSRPVFISNSGVATEITCVDVGHGGTGKTSELEAITNLGGPYLKEKGTEITASSNLDDDYKAMGTYYSKNDSITRTLNGTIPISGSGFKMITAIGYRTQTIRQFLDSSTNNLYYRSSQNTGETWTKWYQLVLLPSGSDNKTFAAIGDATTPVYVDSSGIITKGTKLGGAAYKEANYYAIASHTHTGLTHRTDLTKGSIPNNITYYLENNAYETGTETASKNRLTQVRGFVKTDGRNVYETRVYGFASNSTTVNYLQVGVNYDGTAYYEVGNSEKFREAIGAMADNTDVTTVRQSRSTTGQWRKILIGYDTYSTSTEQCNSPITKQAYIADSIAVQPSTGTIKATTFDGSLAGNAATATKLKDACSIWGHSFDGTADISGHFTMKNTSSRYHYFYIKQNNTNNTIGYIMYDSGNLTNVTTGRWCFAAYSPNSTNDTSTTGFAEIYYLPTVKKGLNANQPYNILTTKDMGFDITGNAATATLATKATGDSDGNAINTTYAKLNGADFTGTVWATKASGAVYIGDYRTDTGLKVYVHINSSSTNHGIYSNGYYNGTTFTSDGAWLIYRNNRGITTVNGNCTGSSGSCTGNAATAAKWESARTITLTGSVTGSIPIDGSSDVILNTTTNHNHDDRYLKTTGGVLTNTLTESLTDDGYFMYFSSQKVTCGSLGLQKITSANERVITLTLGNNESTATKRASGAITLYNTNREFIQIKSLYGKVFSNDTDHTYLNINGWVKTSGVTGAVWNDYAEFRKTNKEAKAGQAVIDNDDGSLSITDKRLMPGAQIVSDTFGFSIGETEEAKTPLAVSGRVLAYTYRPREEYHAGMAVCSAPNGTIDIMTREEIQQYPDAIIGIVSEIPDYEEWGTGNVKVNKRIWIKIK